VSADQRPVELEVDNILLRLRSGSIRDFPGKNVTEVVSTFYHEAQQRQIPLDELHCNPFVFKPLARQLPRPPTGQGDNPPDGTDDQETALAEALEAAGQLRLQAVIKGSNYRKAIISDFLLAEGEQINGWTISKILSGEVVLTWRDHTYVLKMPR